MPNFYLSRSWVRHVMLYRTVIYNNRVSIYKSSIFKCICYILRNNGHFDKTVKKRKNYDGCDIFMLEID